MTSRLLGLVRDQVLAYLFGAGNAMDAFNVAFRIPNLLRDLFAEGAMSAAFVPAFTRRLAREGKAGAWRLGNLVINALLVAAGVVVLAGILGADPLVRLLAGEFAVVPGKLELTAQLTRVLFPFLALVAVAAACMGMLNALHRFFLPSLSPAMFNVATIVGAFVLVPVMPALGLPRIMGIALAGLAGGVGQVALQWVALRKEGFRYEPVLDLKDPGLREVLALMLPGLVGLAAVQVNLFTNTVLATGEGTGAVSWLNYAFRLMYLPIGLVGVSIATAALPAISNHAVAGDRDGVRRTFSAGLRTMLMLSVPATVGLIVLASPIVDLLFRHGSFTEADTAATAAAVACYAPGLVGYSTVRLAVPTFYALGNSRIPVLASILTVILNIVLNVSLVRVMGYRGLALGTAIASLVHAAMLLGLLRGRMEGFDGRRVGVAALKIVAASLVMGAVVAGVQVALQGWLPDSRSLSARLAVVAVTIGAGVAALGLSSHVLRIREFHDTLRALRGRLSGARPPA